MANLNDSKVCSRCKTAKSYSEFPRDKSRRDGYSYCCKACEIARRDPQQKRAYNQQYYADRREAIGAQVEQWRQTNPEKRKAHIAVNTAVDAKRLPPIASLVCAHCGAQAAVYHHWSYAPEHWLDVIPLCDSCHSKVHAGSIDLGA